MGQLRNRMEQDLILRRLSPATRRNDLLYCRKFAAHYGRSPPPTITARIGSPTVRVIQFRQRHEGQAIAVTTESAYRETAWSGASIMMHSVKQVAELLQVSEATIKQFVDSGELDAIDVSLKRGKKRRLRIPEDALHQFLDRRRVFVPPPRPRGRRRSQHRPREVIDYFAPLELTENGRRRLKISEVAEYLGIKEDHVRQLIAYGHLTAVNVGGTSSQNRYRIAEKELFEFVERSRSEPKHQRKARLRGPDFLDNLDERAPNISLTTDTSKS